jgi:DNA repair protein RadC
MFYHTISDEWPDMGACSASGSIMNSQSAYNLMKPWFAREADDVESVFCIFLNAKNEILSIEKIFSGTISAAMIYPRELIKRILALKATAIVMAHNHPSGDTRGKKRD